MESIDKPRSDIETPGIYLEDHRISRPVLIKPLDRLEQATPTACTWIEDGRELERMHGYFDR